jgi:hypothetical protein
MFAIIGTIIGFLPHLFKFLEGLSDNKQELAIMSMQMELAKLNLTAQLQEIGMNAKASEIQSMYSSMKTSIPWVDGFNACVRPIIAIIFTAKMIASCFYPEAAVMNDHDYAILGCIMSFYFGDTVTSRL